MTKSNLPIGESKTKVPYVKVRHFFFVIAIPMGQKKVSILVRCPYSRG